MVNWWLLLSPFIVVSFFFGISTLFARKKYRLWFRRFTHREKALDVIMFLTNKNLYHGVVPINNEKFKFKNVDYLIDPKAIYIERFRMGFRPYSLYVQGNPKPIKIDFTKMKADISSLDLKTFTESSLIQKLLETREEQITKILLIVSFLILAISLFVAYINFKNGNIMLADLEAIKQAIVRQ